MTATDLPSEWRTRAEGLARFAPAAAEAFKSAAEDLEEALIAASCELLPPTEATKVSLSKRRLRELEAEGKLQNYGKKGAPLYRRGELPRRVPGEAGGFDPASHVAAITGVS